jgi:hypothetical protein
MRLCGAKPLLLKQHKVGVQDLGEPLTYGMPNRCLHSRAMLRNPEQEASRIRPELSHRSPYLVEPQGWKTLLIADTGDRQAQLILPSPD